MKNTQLLLLYQKTILIWCGIERTPHQSLNMVRMWNRENLAPTLPHHDLIVQYFELKNQD